MPLGVERCKEAVLLYRKKRLFLSSPSRWACSGRAESSKSL